MPGDATKGSLSISMIIGLLVVPLTAAAVIWLTGSSEEAEAATATTSPPSDADATLETTVVQDVNADLQVACGAEGMQLVSLEEQGTINDVQQAALDALRGLCEQEGLALPAPPVEEPVVQTVVQSVAPAAAAPPPTTAGTLPDTVEHDDDDWDDDDDRDDDDDDDDDDWDDDDDDDDRDDD